MDATGRFETDKAERITKMRVENGVIYAEVTWKAREDGVVPMNSVFTNTELKQWDPLMLCEYYESVLKVKKV